MAWTREFQTGFEMGRASECPWTNSFSPQLEYSTVRPITGEFSFYQTGRGGHGYFFESEPTQIRTGWLFNTEGGLENVPTLLVYCRESGGVGFVQWGWLPLNMYMNLVYSDQDDDVVDSDTVDTTAVRVMQSDAITASMGLVMKVGAGGYASFYVNGERVLHISATAAGLEQATSIFAVKLGETNLGFSGLYETHFDDWYIDTGGGSETNAAPPIKRFGIKRPTGAGSATNWTGEAGANWNNIDEQIGSDNDYNYSSTPTDDDRFEFGSFSLPDDSTIDAVIPIVRAKAGTPNPQLNIRLIADDGVSGYGSEQELRLGYTYLWERYTTKPSGGSWSESDVNSAEYGYELRS